MRTFVLAVLLFFLPACSSSPSPDNSIFTEIARRSGVHPRHENSGNAIVEKKFQDAFTTYLATLKGQKVVLSLTIAGVTETGVTFESPTLPAVLPANERERIFTPHVRFWLYFNSGDQADNKPTRLPELPSPLAAVFGGRGATDQEKAASKDAYDKNFPNTFRPPAPDPAFLERLRKGQSLTIQATVSEVVPQHGPYPDGSLRTELAGGTFITLVFTNVKLR